MAPSKKKRRASAETPEPVSPSPSEASAPAPVETSAAPIAPIAALPPLATRDAWTDRAIVALAALATFARALPYPLVGSWDDRRFLVDDTLVTHPSVEALVSIWSAPHFEAYHPLHLMSYWLDVPWLGATGPVVRTTSLLLFVLAGVAMLSWLRALGVGRAAALLATLAFVVHPIQVELVVWGTGRKDVLAVLFVLLSWTLHLRSTSPWDREAWISRALFLCAMLAKTSAVSAPLAMLATDLWLGRRSPREALLRQAPSLAIAALLGAVTIAIWRENEMIRAVDEAGTSATLVLASLSHAIVTSVLPATVSPMYAMVQDDPPSTGFLFVGIVVAAASLAFAWQARDTFFGRMVGAGVGTFLALYAPVSNLIPTYYQMQDRYLSLPLLGAALVLAAILDRGRPSASDARPSTAVLVLGLLCVVPLAARTIDYEGVWSSDARLWAHATSTHPRSYYAWMKLGEVRRDEGRYDGAIEAYGRAIEIRPQQRLGHGALMMVLALRDERDEHLSPSAAEELTATYLRDSDDPDALSADAGDATVRGYRYAALMFMGRHLDLRPVSDERLEQAANIQLANQREWLARFYLGRMTRPPLSRSLRAFWAAERERLGMPPLEETRPDTSLSVGGGEGGTGDEAVHP